MPDVPEELRDRYIHLDNGYETDNLINSLDDRALLQHMGVPQKFWTRAIRLHQQPMHPEIEEWIKMLPYIFRPQFDKQDENPDLLGVGLVFHGPAQTGKTTAAVALLLRLVRMLLPNADPSGRSRWYGARMGQYVGWQDASRLYRDSIDDEEADNELADLERSMRPLGDVKYRGDYLVMDDISRERATAFNINQLTGLLRGRNEHGYPTIVTTNLGPGEWYETYGPVMDTFLSHSMMSVEFDAVTQ